MKMKLSAIILEPTRPDIGSHVEIFDEEQLADALTDLAASLTNEYPTTRAEHRRVVTVQIEFLPDQEPADEDQSARILQRLSSSGLAEARACAKAMDVFAEATKDARVMRTLGR